MCKSKEQQMDSAGEDTNKSLEYNANDVTAYPQYPIDRKKFGVDTREYWKWRIKNL